MRTALFFHLSFLFIPSVFCAMETANDNNFLMDDWEILLPNAKKNYVSQAEKELKSAKDQESYITTKGKFAYDSLSFTLLGSTKERDKEIVFKQAINVNAISKKFEKAAQKVQKSQTKDDTFVFIKKRS